MNYAAALAADRVLFNSRYHLACFLDELPRLLKHYPDYNELDTVGRIRSKAEILSLGLDLHRHDAERPAVRGSRPPAILWNHRWEYDKNPAEFLAALYELDRLGLDFGVILLGESLSSRGPDDFVDARRHLARRIVHFGYEPDPAIYSRLLWQADLVVSTAYHEFFGAAVTEAIYCGCHPVLPDRLAYPELIPERLHPRCLYSDHDGLLSRLAGFLQGARPSDEDRAALRCWCAGFDWSELATEYDDRLAAVVGEHRKARLR